ncbi:hypothetical protein SPONL_2275 [uncultured Candidatus Thioglobus sp.]|nr:hypothetical protein SPONL_2275 [uncultured Candidatus Thioglobus sp.]
MAIDTKNQNIQDLILGDLDLFHIPIYQREYTWEATKHVQRLLDDIVEFGNEYQDNLRAEYYIGNIIIKKQDQGFTPKRLIVDGQQRITTTILMLCAIRDIYKDYPSHSEEQKFANSIQKSLYSNDDGVKLKINNMNNQQELTLLLSGQNTSIKQTKYTENYLHILNYLQQKNEEELKQFVGLLHRIKVVLILLDYEQDENAVFESINSLGKPLTGGDLIKNYLFTFKYDCDINCENELINLYTDQFENLFKEPKEIEAFFRIYIAIKTRWLYKQEAKTIYYQFKKTIGNIDDVEQCHAILNELCEFALIYQTLKIKGHKQIDSNHLGYLRSVFTEYAPLLIQVLKAYSHIDNHQIIIDEENKFNDFLKSIVAYQASRFIVGEKKSRIIRFIPMVFEQLKNGYSQHSNYADKFLALVSSVDNKHRMPNIDQTKVGALSTRLYGKIETKSLLILLENIDKNELLDYEKATLKKATIEHIMPQKLSNEWNHITQEQHSEYLHVLGNLTLTLDNTKLSNLGFDKKKKILLEKSKITLNNDLQRYSEFNVDVINSRGLALIEKFTKEYL